MEQIIQLYQARHSDQKDHTNNPLQGVIDPWLGKGYYFWEHELKNAERWGKTHYGGNYDIYESSYQNNVYGLDFVDNYKHIDLLEKVYDHLKTSGRNPMLGRAVGLVKNWFGKKLDIKYIRIDTGSFFPSDKLTFDVPNHKPIWMYRQRLVQVCMLEYPYPAIGFITYKFLLSSRYRVMDYPLTLA